MNKQFDKYFVVSSFVLLILGVTLFSYLDYQEHKETFYEHIDEKLLSSAKTTLHILPLNFHDRALAPSSNTFRGKGVMKYRDITIANHCWQGSLKLS